MSIPKIFLASKSPRRKMLLEAAGFDVEVIPLDCREEYPSSLPTQDIAQYLAVLKMSRALVAYPTLRPLLTADTIVVLDGKVLEKPLDAGHASDMLRALAGRVHQVHTGVSIALQGEQITFTSSAHVYLNAMSADEIEYYIDHWRPFDKAGSYGIQDWIGWAKVARIEGSYATIMGLPVDQVYDLLTGQGSIS